MFKKLRKSSYVKDKEFFNWLLLIDNKDDLDKDKKVSIPIKATFVENGDDIDRSTLYSFTRSFELLIATCSQPKILHGDCRPIHLQNVLVSYEK